MWIGPFDIKIKEINPLCPILLTKMTPNLNMNELIYIRDFEAVQKTPCHELHYRNAAIQKRCP